MVNLLSLKSIELQVALPRSQDAGKLQDQMSREGQRFQESLAQSQLKKDVKKRKTVNEFEKMTKSKIEDEEFKEKQRSSPKEKEEAELEEVIDHPYLGNKIDFSG